MLTRRTRNRRLCLAALAALAPLQLLAIVVHADDPGDRVADVVVADPPPPAPPTSAPPPPAPPTTLETTLVTSGPAPMPPVELAPTAAAPAPSAPPVGRGSFADRFPAQAAATQDPDDPASTRWAVLIGINEHRGGVPDNIGSRQDAEDLRAHLLANGWRDDHILLLTDRQATRADIVDGIAWLAAKTDERSVAVFHYSGHAKRWTGRDIDGDGEVTDEGLWPSDDAFIPDSELVALLDPVRPRALWLSFATCNAAGLADPGMDQPGRILTFSSGEPQKSYEHPSWGNSVWGWFVIEQAMVAGHGDLDRDGRVTVEEAFAWAHPRAIDATRHQRHGTQEAVIVDRVPGDLDLLVPGAPPPTPTRALQMEADPSTSHRPVPAATPDQPPTPRRQEPTRKHHGNHICLLCSR